MAGHTVDHQDQPAIMWQGKEDSEFQATLWYITGTRQAWAAGEERRHRLMGYKGFET